MSRPVTYYESRPRPRLTLVKRRTLIEYQRDLLVQRFAEVDALRADLKRLQRQATQVGRCAQCRILNTITICEDGAFRCRRCQLAPKGETA